MKQRILLKLQTDIRFRERKFRLVGIMQIIVDKYGNTITTQNAEDIAGDILSADRVWRKALEDDTTIRGKDYDDGVKLSQEYQLNHLGVEPGIEPIIKKVKIITNRDGSRVARII